MEDQIQTVGRQLYKSMKASYSHRVHAHRWESEILRWCLQDETLRTQTLRFIDCLPALQQPSEVVAHLREYFPEHSSQLPLPLRIGLASTRVSLITSRIVSMITQRTAARMAQLFIAGSNLREGFATLRRLESDGFRLSVDLVGEATTSQKAANLYAGSYLELIRRWKNHLLTLPHLSLKLSSLSFPFDPIDPQGAWRQIHMRLKSIMEMAFAHEGFVNIDMEQYYFRDLVLELVRRIMDEEFPLESRVGVVLQAYLKDSEMVARRLIEWTRKRGVPITVRLVRGAYWDSEVITSRQQNWPCPVYTTKRETDASFERLTDLLLENHRYIHVAVGTHNLRSLARAIAKARQLQIPADHWETQVLYGMGEPIQKGMLEMGVSVRVYAPIGESISAMAYLVRRVLENTSQTSFLVRGLLEDRPVEELLQAPEAVAA